MSLQAVLDQIDSHLEESLGRLLEFLKIRSISTDPRFDRDCKDAASWLANELRGIGFDAACRESDGKPFVTVPAQSGSSTSLFYGHYDVQPVDPIDKWNRDPFDPRVESLPDGAVIRGRGSSDDKGQLMTFVEACRAWAMVHGSVPRNISMLFEGEEESGSPSLVPFLKENSRELKSDVALICDTGLFNHDTPAIVVMLRGLLGEEVTISGSNQDLHSGMYGGIAINPARVLTRILANLHDREGRITLPGFYDGVDELPKQVRDQWASLDFSHGDFLGPVGLGVPAGEVERMPLEMIWSRPTCDVNGIVGGYCGSGFKTVIPSQASAKVSFRLVGNQDPHKIRKAFRFYVRSCLPSDTNASFKEHGTAYASQFSKSGNLFAAVETALASEWPCKPVHAGCGGSIPIAGHFKEILDMESILVGFGKDNDGIHAPNEKYDLRSFHLGTRTWARVIAEIG